MLRGLIYAVISASAYASMAVLVKLGYNAGMSGPVMMQNRFFFAVLIMVPFLLIRDRSLFKISFKNLLKCAFLGMVVFWAQTTCFVSALATIPASTTALVLYGHPVLVTILSAAFLKMQVNKVVLFSLMAVTSGCCLVFYDAFLREVDGMGLAFAAGAMTIFALYLILVQVLLKGIRPLTATFYVLIFTMIAFTLSGDLSALKSLTMEQLTISALLGLFPGVVGITLLYSAIEKIGSAYACIFSSVEPVVTLAGAALFLGEPIIWLQIGGAILIILGIVVPNLRARRPIDLT